jgi:hypothetical protein
MNLATVTDINQRRVMPSERGFAPLWRDIDKQPWYRKHEGRYTAVFIHLLLKASTSDRIDTYRGQTSPLKPGQLARTYEQLAKELGQTKSQVQNAFIMFKKLGQITTKSDGKFTVITLEKHAKFNTVNNTVNNTVKPLTECGLKPILNTGNNTANNTQKNNSLEESLKDAGSSEQRLGFLEIREKAFEHFWKTWSDSKKLIGSKNTATKATTKSKFLKIFTDSKVEHLGDEKFNAEINDLCQLAWLAHCDIAEKDKTREQSDWFNHRNMYPDKFLSNKQWRESEWKL